MNNKFTVGLLAAVLVALRLSACGPAASNQAAAKPDSPAATQEDGLTKEGIVVQRADRPLAGPPNQSATANSNEIFLLVETTDANNNKEYVKLTGPATLGQLPQAAVGDRVKFSLDPAGVGLTGFEVVRPKNLPVLRPQVMR